MRVATRGYIEPMSAWALQLLAHTGLRKDEIISLKWPMIDWQHAVFNLPDSMSGICASSGAYEAEYEGFPRDRPKSRQNRDKIGPDDEDLTAAHRHVSGPGSWQARRPLGRAGARAGSGHVANAAVEERGPDCPLT